MRKTTSILSLIVLLAFIGCASLGTGRPEVVRAEDVLTNSLTVYDTAMAWHFAHSREESPAVYAVFEKVRTGFPLAWNTLDAAIKAYKNTGSNPDLPTALKAVESLLHDLETVWAPSK